MLDTQIQRPERQLSPGKAEAILAGAMQEFLAHGYAATSMDKVAKAARVSKATVYSHFGDKEGLFTALVQNMAQQKISRLFQEQALEGDPRVMLPLFLKKALEQVVNDQQHLGFIRLIIGESGRFPQLAQIFVRNLTKPGLEILTQYFASQPQLNIADPEAAARIVAGTLVYHTQVQVMLHGSEIIPMDCDRIVQAVSDMLLSQAHPGE